MNRHTLHTILASVAIILAAPGAMADKPKTVLDVKTTISDNDIIFPESYEMDTQKMLEGWYMKNYTATDDRYLRQGDTNVSDAVIRERLAKLNTVIDMPFNQIVRSYIDRYTSAGRSMVPALLGLSIYYMPIFEQALEEEGLPLELKYIPVIESALNPNAVSKHGAAGLWQFMLLTGKGMDMEINSVVDERRDPYLSSKKAAKLLKQLHDTYGDWSLAIAAYNCGSGTVNKAIRRAGGDPGSHDFWSLYYYLPAETRGYVPMFIAANYVMNYYPYHNISPVLATKPLVTDTLMISKRVHFNQISKVLDIPVDELRVLNPQFRADYIPGSSEHAYTLVLPSQQCHAYIMSENDILAYEADKYARRVEAAPGAEPSGNFEAVTTSDNTLVAQRGAEETPLEQPAEEQPTPVKKTGNSATKTVSHKVEPGETLASIAAKYNVTPEDIKSWNGMTRNAVRTGQRLRITASSDIATASGASEVAQPVNSGKSVSTPKNNTKNNAAGTGKNKNKSAAQKSKKAKAPTSHSVKSGENLSTIAKKYGTTAEALKKANNLKSDALQPGDVLKLPSKGGSKATGSKSKAKNKGKTAAKGKKAGKGKKNKKH